MVTCFFKVRSKENLWPSKGLHLIKPGPSQDNLPFRQLKINWFGTLIMSTKCYHCCIVYWLKTRHRFHPHPRGVCYTRRDSLGGHLRVCLLYTLWFKGQKKKDKQGKPRRMASEKRKEGEKGDCWSREITWRSCFNCVICCPEAEKDKKMRMNKWLSDLVKWPWQRVQWLNVSLIRSRFTKAREVKMWRHWAQTILLRSFSVKGSRRMRW